MRKQIRLLLMALPMLLGLASCAEHDNPDPNPLAKQVSGMWWSLADQEGTYKDVTDSYPYTRLGQAICFNEDGTGYGITFFFDDDNSDPIAIIGGEDICPPGLEVAFQRAAADGAEAVFLGNVINF